MIHNAVIDAIHARRSTRVFLPKQIEDSQLKTILDCATWAPSGGNNQSWLFTAIQNADALNKINALLREGFQAWTPDDAYPSKLSAKKSAQHEGCNFFFHAPTLIIASNVPNYQNAMTDCALALQNIFLSAHSLGLGSCYINQLRWLRDDVNLRSYLADLGIPKEHVICGSAVIGYIGKESAPPPRKVGCVNVVK